MFTSKNRVRMHDTDMVGVLYFPRQFRFFHDALEDLMEAEGISFQELFANEDYLFVIVHAESDYLQPLVIGDELEVRVEVDQIGTTSFTLNYEIYKSDGEHVGRGKTVHVCINKASREKISVPNTLRNKLTKHACA